MQNLMCFENNKVEVLMWNDKILFNPYNVGSCLGLSDSAVRMSMSKMSSNQVVKLTNSNVNNIDFRKLHNTGENFLTESGVYKLVFKSRKEEAERFTDWIADEVLPSIRKHGSYTAPNPKPKHQESKEVYKKPVRKFFGGRPVMTLKDLAYLMSTSKEMAVYYLRLHGIAGVKLEGKHLRDFKCENRQINTINSLLIFEEAHVEWFLRQLGQFEEHKAFFNAYFALDYNANLSREEMYLAVKQASLLFDTAREIKDPHAKAQALKAVTVILINIGLWDDRQHGYNGVTSEWSINSTEGWNKVDVLRKAKKQFLL